MCKYFLFLVSFIAVYAQVPEDFEVKILNVRVPVEDISLDSSGSDNILFFSGNAYYDLFSSHESISISVFLEEVPFSKTLIRETWRTSNAPFVKIDSLCEGDLGAVTPGLNRKIRWRYGSRNKNNHCRIKIGTGNYAFVLTRTTEKRPGQDSIVNTREYTNIGIPINPLKRLNRYGQLLTSPPVWFTRYDNQHRLIYEQRGQIQTLQYIFGFSYDSLSRVVRQDDLPPEFTPESPGPAFNRHSFAYDGKNRLISEDYYVSSPFISCPDNNFLYRYSYSYLDDASSRLDIRTLDIADTMQGGKIIFQTKDNFSHSPYPGPLFSGWVSESKGYNDSGSCYGSDQYIKDSVIFVQGNQYFAYKFIDNAIYESNLTPLKKIAFKKDNPDGLYRLANVECSPRIIDNRGRLTIQYKSFNSSDSITFECPLGDTLQIAEQFEYNEYNFPTRYIEWPKSESEKSIEYHWDLINLDDMPSAGGEEWD